jgi:hypothetical protein
MGLLQASWEEVAGLSNGDGGGGYNESSALSERGALMKRILVVLTVVALMLVMLAMAVGPAFATQPTEFNPPQHPGGSRNSDNCVAYNSAQVKHNGSAVRNQNRQSEVKGMQASCNHANQK